MVIKVCRKKKLSITRPSMLWLLATERIRSATTLWVGAVAALAREEGEQAVDEGWETLASAGEELSALAVGSTNQSFLTYFALMN